MKVKADMIYDRESFGITYDPKRKEVFVFGGYNGGVLENCEKYSIAKNEWTELK